MPVWAWVSILGSSGRCPGECTEYTSWLGSPDYYLLFGCTCDNAHRLFCCNLSNSIALGTAGLGAWTAHVGHFSYSVPEVPFTRDGMHLLDDILHSGSDIPMGLYLTRSNSKTNILFLLLFKLRSNSIGLH